MLKFPLDWPPGNGDRVHHDRHGLGLVVDSGMYPSVGVDFGDGSVVYAMVHDLYLLNLPFIEPPSLDDLPHTPEHLLCDFCINGLQPAGLHDDLGPVFASCLICYGPCRNCDGDGLFPADETCVPCYANALAARGLIAERCADCFGISDLIPTTGPTEVNPHAHRN